MTSAAVVTVSSKKRFKNATTVSSCFKNDAIEIFDSLLTNVPDSPAFRTRRRMQQVARDASDAVLMVNNELNDSNVTEFVRNDNDEIHGDGIDVCETVLIDKKRHKIILIPGTDFKISESWDNILTVTGEDGCTVQIDEEQCQRKPYQSKKNQAVVWVGERGGCYPAWTGKGCRARYH